MPAMERCETSRERRTRLATLILAWAVALEDKDCFLLIDVSSLLSVERIDVDVDVTSVARGVFTSFDA